MATFKKATIGEMIDDVKCPQCKAFKLRLVGLHLYDTDTPLLIQCHNCGMDLETNNNMEGLKEESTNEI